MWSLIAKAIGWLIKLLAPKGESSDYRAGAAEAKLEIKETSDDKVAKAIDAGGVVDRNSVSDPDSLRAPDPNSRD